MRYLFIDCEFISQRNGHSKICEFGYVITDENFNHIAQSNLIINPNIDRTEYDWRVVRKILTRKISEYENSPMFSEYYPFIANLIKSSDAIIGHGIDGDVRALNDECKRYNLPSTDFTFYDNKDIYKDYKGISQNYSVLRISEELNIGGETIVHDAEFDALNVMKSLEMMVKNLGVTFEELISACSENVKRSTKDYVLFDHAGVSDVTKIHHNFIKNFGELLESNGTNDMRKWDSNFVRYISFLDNVKPVKVGKGLFNNKKISISINYEEHHYRQVLNIAQMIANEGGTLILKASLADIYVSYYQDDDNEVRKRDSKLDFVKESNENGANIQIIELDDFLKLFSLTKEQLDLMPFPSFDCLFDKNAIIKNKNFLQFINEAKSLKKEDKK